MSFLSLFDSLSCRCVLNVYVLAAVGVLIVVAGAAPAFAAPLNVDLDFVSYEREFFCPDCQPYNHWKSGYVYPDADAGSFDMVVITFLLENNRGTSLYLKNLGLFLNYHVDSDVFTQYQYWRINNHLCDYDNVPTMCSNSDYELYVPDKCDRSSLDRSIVHGASEEVTLCFPVPVGVTDYQAFGIVASDRQFIRLDGVACEDITNSKNRQECGGTWDLTRQIVNDGVYEYTIADASIYNSVYSGYDQVVNDAVANALGLWSDANPHISFELVDNRNDADFDILMGGTGEAVHRVFGGVVDRYGSVNDVGCLVEHDIDCNLTLFVENRNRDGTIELLSPQMLEYVTVHEVGHLLGLPHHPSALHSMHSPLDAVVDWYDSGEYGFVAPPLMVPAIQTMTAAGQYGELVAAYDALFERLSGSASESEIELSRIIVALFELLG